MKSFLEYVQIALNESVLLEAKSQLPADYDNGHYSEHLANIAGDPNTSASDLTKLSELKWKGDGDTYHAHLYGDQLASNPTTPTHALANVFRHGSDTARHLIAHHPNATTNLLNHIWRNKDWSTTPENKVSPKYLLASSSKISDGTLNVEFKKMKDVIGKGEEFRSPKTLMAIVHHPKMQRFLADGEKEHFNQQYGEHIPHEGFYNEPKIQGEKSTRKAPVEEKFDSYYNGGDTSDIHKFVSSHENLKPEHLTSLAYSLVHNDFHGSPAPTGEDRRLAFKAILEHKNVTPHIVKLINHHGISTKGVMEIAQDLAHEHGFPEEGRDVNGITAAHHVMGGELLVGASKPYTGSPHTSFNKSSKDFGEINKKMDELSEHPFIKEHFDVEKSKMSLGKANSEKRQIEASGGIDETTPRNHGSVMTLKLKR